MQLAQSPIIGQQPLYVSSGMFQTSQLPHIPGLSPDQVNALLAAAGYQFVEVAAQPLMQSGPVQGYAQQVQAAQLPQQLHVVTTGSSAPTSSSQVSSPLSETQGTLPSHLLSSGSTSTSSYAAPSAPTSPEFPQEIKPKQEYTIAKGTTGPNDDLIIQTLRREWAHLKDDEILGDREVFTRAKTAESLRMIIERFNRYEVVLQDLSFHFMKEIMRDYSSMPLLFDRWSRTRKGMDHLALNAVLVGWDRGFSKVERSSGDGKSTRLTGMYRFSVIGPYYRDLLINYTAELYSQMENGAVLERFAWIAHAEFIES